MKSRILLKNFGLKQQLMKATFSHFPPINRFYIHNSVKGLHCFHLKVDMFQNHYYSLYDKLPTYFLVYHTDGELNQNLQFLYSLN